MQVSAEETTRLINNLKGLRDKNDTHRYIYSLLVDALRWTPPPVSVDIINNILEDINSFDLMQCRKVLLHAGFVLTPCKEK